MLVVAKDYPPSECAKDMEAGLNVIGSPFDHDINALLARVGGVAFLAFCPVCQCKGRESHGLKIEKRENRFRVTAFSPETFH